MDEKEEIIRKLVNEKNYDRNQIKDLQTQLKNQGLLHEREKTEMKLSIEKKY